MEKVFVGKIVNTHGIKGEVRLISDFEFKNRALKKDNFLIIGDKTLKISGYRVHKCFDMITFYEFNNINDVLPMVGSKVYIDKDSLNLTSDEYLLSDLIDCEIICNDEVLGKVIDYTNDANPLLIVMSDKKFYIPLNGSFIIKVQSDEKKIIVDESVRGLIL